MTSPVVWKTPAEVRSWRASLGGKRLALVPTMGFLHDGHLSLMREGLKRADVCAVSIFVNPTQFGPKEDLSRYPRDAAGDLAKCGSAGVLGVYMPEPASVYPPGYQTYVNVEDVSTRWDGASRPGHPRIYWSSARTRPWISRRSTRSRRWSRTGASTSAPTSTRQRSPTGRASTASSSTACRYGSPAA